MAAEAEARANGTWTPITLSNRLTAGAWPVIALLGGALCILVLDPLQAHAPWWTLPDAADFLAALGLGAGGFWLGASLVLIAGLLVLIAG